MPTLLTPDDWTPRGVADLEPNAHLVVRSISSTSVVAGPGAGKTETLAQRAAYLLETGACPYPRRILAISFKKDAARNLRARVDKRVGAQLAVRFDSLTFDAFAKRILDQFREALPAGYRPTQDYIIIGDPKRDELAEMFRQCDPPVHLGRCAQLVALASDTFFKDHVPKVNFDRAPSNLAEWALLQLWQEMLRGQPRSRLTFRMITRLAGMLVRRDARLARAYRSAYSHAFLDEFQDTTDLQYGLTKVLFMGSSTVLTAVGDPQQRIMGWANALDGVFERYRADFNASHYRLHRNHRASVHIAPLVRFIARKIGLRVDDDGVVDPDEVLPGSGPPAEACAAYTFPNSSAEAEWIAREVATLVHEKHVRPRDVGILVRMKVPQYAATIIDALRTQDVLARVEESAQELLAEPIAEFIILGLRALGSDRPGANWAALRSLIAESEGIEPSDTVGQQRVERRLEALRTVLHPMLVPSDTSELRTLLDRTLLPLLDGVRRGSPQYRDGHYYETKVNDLCKLICASTAESGTWSDTLDTVEGVNSVPILSIHKSKGLEYHTVVFVGLEDRAFFNFHRNASEEQNAFFVAISRAKERVILTFAHRRTSGDGVLVQSRNQINALYRILDEAGVPHLEPAPEVQTRSGF